MSAESRVTSLTQMEFTNICKQKTNGKSIKWVLPLIMLTISSASRDKSPPGRNGLSHPDSVLNKIQTKRKYSIKLSVFFFVKANHPLKSTEAIEIAYQLMSHKSAERRNIPKLSLKIMTVSSFSRHFEWIIKCGTVTNCLIFIHHFIRFDFAGFFFEILFREFVFIWSFFCLLSVESYRAKKKSWADCFWLHFGNNFGAIWNREQKNNRKLIANVVFYFCFKV